MMKKKHLIIFLLIVVLSVTFMNVDVFHKEEKSFSTIVNYQGSNLRVSVDGVNSVTLPTSDVYLVDYQCDNPATVVTWDRESKELSVSNGKIGGGVSCDLTFESNPQLSKMPVGSYVAYTGSGGTVGSTSVSCKLNGAASTMEFGVDSEAPNSCNGQNVREDLDTSGFTHGYCSLYQDIDGNYNFPVSYNFTTGWRIAYIHSNHAVLVSAGTPECLYYGNHMDFDSTILELNTKALKYCNSDFVDGNCSCVDNDGDELCDSASADVWAINDEDFYYMNGSNFSLGFDDGFGYDENNLTCDGFSSSGCGRGNDLIDIGESYFFAFINNGCRELTMWVSIGQLVLNGGSDEFIRSHDNNRIGLESPQFNLGFRPMIRISSAVYVVGGSGTMDDPYQININ